MALEIGRTAFAREVRRARVEGRPVPSVVPDHGPPAPVTVTSAPARGPAQQSTLITIGTHPPPEVVPAHRHPHPAPVAV